jgi:hypothetical protein
MPVVPWGHVFCQQSYADQGLDARQPQPNRIHDSRTPGAAIIQIQGGTGQGGVGHGGRGGAGGRSGAGGLGGDGGQGHAAAHAPISPSLMCCVVIQARRPGALESGNAEPVSRHTNSSM